MSLYKIPAILVVALGAELGTRPPNAEVPKGDRKAAEGPFSLHLIAIMLRSVHLLHATIEMMIIAFALYPTMPLAIKGLNLLMPEKDPSLIQLSPLSIFAAIVVGLSAIGRLLCYHEMGKNFTFAVTILKDHKLITTGPYGIVRHPSYTFALGLHLGMFMWYAAAGSWIMESEKYKYQATLMILFYSVTSASYVEHVLRRVKFEDGMLREEFGKAWDEWASSTRYRLIPGVY